MCACETHTASTSAEAALTFTVADMTCGHCAGTIKSAVERGLPGAIVTADPASRRVSITGANDRAAVARLITEAGYTPA